MMHMQCRSSEEISARTEAAVAHVLEWSSALLQCGDLKIANRTLLCKIRCRRWPFIVSAFLAIHFALISLHFASAQPQTTDYARYIIDTLSSKEMNGRGYVDSADFKAATFIANESRKLNLSSFTPDYFQTFTFSANTFPGKMIVEYSSRELLAGKDFLVDAASPGMKGKFEVVPIIKTSADTAAQAGVNALGALRHKKGKPVFLSIRKSDWTKKQYQLFNQAMLSAAPSTVRGLVELDTSKLTWHAAQETIPWLRLTIRDTMFRSAKVKVDIDATLKKNYLSRNVIAFIPGSTSPDSFIVFTAHYDHLGQMGDGTYFPGANDNASGTSMVLNLARHYAQHRPDYTMVFICFAGEELGLLGSYYFTGQPLFPLDKIKLLINLDIVGTGDEGIKVVNATEFPKQFDQLVKLNEQHQYLKQVSPRGKSANSDHYPFYLKGVPGFFIYTLGGIGAYHDVNDRAETLPLTAYDNLMKLLIDFVKEL